MIRRSSMVEWAVVLTVCLLLGVVLVPKYQQFRAKGYQAEAVMNLRVISSLEKAYQLRHDGRFWGGFPMARPLTLMRGNCQVENALGFSVPDCTKSRYTYSVRVNADASGFLAYAQEWSVNGRRVFSHCGGEAPRIAQIKTPSGYWIDKTIRGHDRWSMSLGDEPRQVTDGAGSCEW